MTCRLRCFCRDSAGAVTLFFLLLVPVLLLVGGLATDAVLMNAQKRHVQAQADLAAESAVRLLPDYARARATAQAVVNGNASYGRITLATQNVQFGTMAANGDFVLNANQANPTGASVVKVTVPSPFAPILLRPVLADNALVIQRSAYAGSRALAVFTLRNRLLRVDSRQSLLNPVFSGLGLAFTVTALDYTGLASARVKLDQLLGLAKMGVGVAALSFDDVLDLPVTVPVLLSGLVSQGALPAAAMPKTTYTGRSVTFREIMAVSPSLLKAKIGDVLPNVTVNGFDTLLLLLGLSSQPTARVSAATGLDLSPLVSVNASLGMVRPAVVAIGQPGDVPPPKAVVSQVSLTLGSTVLGETNAALLNISGDVQVGTADATLVSLNCAAKAGSDTLAVFEMQTAPVELGLTVTMSDSRSGVAPTPLNRLKIAGSKQQVSVRLDQLRKPVTKSNPISLATTSRNLADVLDGIRQDLSGKTKACDPGLLSLLCPLGNVLNGTVVALVTVLTGITKNLAWVLGPVEKAGVAGTQGSDRILQAVLDLFGISVAQSEVILDDYSCSSKLLR